jgi:thiazole synthase ThiGH ThiG subunit
MSVLFSGAGKYRALSRVRAALGVIHKAIVTAKMRRVRRELMFHSKDIRDFPQRPLILGDKWDF